MAAENVNLVTRAASFYASHCKYSFSSFSACFPSLFPNPQKQKKYEINALFADFCEK